MPQQRMWRLGKRRTRAVQQDGASTVVLASTTTDIAPAAQSGLGGT